MPESPLRVALLTNYVGAFSPSGGVAQLYKNLAEGLGRAGHHVTVIGVDVAPEYVSIQAWGTCVSLASRTFPKVRLPRSVMNALAVAREVFKRRRDFDVLECSSWPGLGAFVGFVRAPLVVQVITSILVDSDVPRRMTLAQFMLEFLTVRNAAFVIGSTTYILEASKRQYRVRLPHSTRIPLGVPDVRAPDISPEIRSRVRFLVIAGALRRKGTDVMLRALEIAGRSRDDFEVVLICPHYATYENYTSISSERQQLWTSVNTLLGDRVTVITEASEDEKLTELMKAHFLIMPSRSESFGLPVVEAMRAGTPVISSSGGALGEVVGVADVNRIYDDPEDADALAEIIVEMTSKGVEQALQRRSAARNAYEQYYTVDNFVAKSVLAYRAAIRLQSQNGSKARSRRGMP